MTQAVAVLRSIAFEAALDEAGALSRVNDAVAVVFPGATRFFIRREPSVGVKSASWTSPSGKRGLAISQDAWGSLIAEDIWTGSLIGQGDGLSGLLPAIVKFYQDGLHLGLHGG